MEAMPLMLTFRDILIAFQRKKKSFSYIASRDKMSYT